jgi:hypothetical protein
MTVVSPVALIRREPALVIGAGVSTIIIMCLGFIPHLTPTEMAAAATITTVVTAIVTAFLTQPVNVSVISGAFTTGLVAASAFGLHLKPAAIAVIGSAVIVLLNYLLREKVSPVVGMK